MKIIVAHPDKQHSYRLATALKKANLLDCFITTVYDKETSITHKIKEFLIGKNKEKANSRKCSDLDDSDILLQYEFLNLIIIYLSRFPIFLNVCRLLRIKLSDIFGLRVAKIAIKRKVDAVIMFDSTALSCFKYIKKHNDKIKCILDTSTVSHSFMKKTFDKEIEISNDFTIKKEFNYLWNPTILQRYDEEITSADFFLSPSDIVAKSLIYSGVDKKQIKKIPYGVDISKFNLNKYEDQHSKLRLLFVGQVNCRKGINHLLNALSKIDEKLIELYIAGNFDHAASWYKKYQYMQNVHYLGFVNHDQINILYSKCDLFVLPTLAEGMALVGLEAMASGLPILCTQFSGINDLIINQYNGIIYDVFEEFQLFNNIIWCISNRQSIITMGKNARRTVENYSWDTYYKNIEKNIKEIIMRENDQA